MSSENKFHETTWIVGSPDIGEGTWIGAFTVIDGSGGLQIGRGCDISSGVHIYTHSSAKRCVSERGHSSVEQQKVIVGNFVFIGANAVVNMGVRIGDHSVIGAGAVVTSDVEAYSIVAGVPAKKIGTVNISDNSEVKFDIS